MRRFIRLPREDAQDVLSLALIRLWTEVRRHPDLDPVERWSPSYLSGTLRFAIHDWLRAKRKEGVFPASQAIEEDSQFADPRAEAELEARLFRIAVQTEVLTWSPDDRRFFDQLIAAALQGSSDAKIAAQLGIPPSTLSSRKLKLLAKLEAALEAPLT